MLARKSCNISLNDDQTVFFILATILDMINPCYQILPFLFDFKLKCSALPPSKHSIICVVVSPLISLMVDQVTNLRANGIGCAILSGSSGMNESLLASEKGIRSGDYVLLYCAPEAIHNRNLSALRL